MGSFNKDQRENWENEFKTIEHVCGYAAHEAAFVAVKAELLNGLDPIDQELAELTTFRDFGGIGWKFICPEKMPATYFTYKKNREAFVGMYVPSAVIIKGGRLINTYFDKYVPNRVAAWTKHEHIQEALRSATESYKRSENMAPTLYGASLISDTTIGPSDELLKYLADRFSPLCPRYNDDWVVIFAGLPEAFFALVERGLLNIAKNEGKPLPSKYNESTPTLHSLRTPHKCKLSSFLSEIDPKSHGFMLPVFTSDSIATSRKIADGCLDEASCPAEAAMYKYLEKYYWADEGRLEDQKRVPLPSDDWLTGVCGSLVNMEYPYYHDVPSDYVNNPVATIFDRFRLIRNIYDGEEASKTKRDVDKRVAFRSFCMVKKYAISPSELRCFRERKSTADLPDDSVPAPFCATMVDAFDHYRHYESQKANYDDEISKDLLKFRVATRSYPIRAVVFADKYNFANADKVETSQQMEERLQHRKEEPAEPEEKIRAYRVYAFPTLLTRFKNVFLHAAAIHCGLLPWLVLRRIVHCYIYAMVDVYDVSAICEPFPEQMLNFDGDYEQMMLVCHLRLIQHLPLGENIKQLRNSLVSARKRNLYASNNVTAFCSADHYHQNGRAGGLRWHKNPIQRTSDKTTDGKFVETESGLGSAENAQAGSSDLAGAAKGKDAEMAQQFRELNKNSMSVNNIISANSKVVAWPSHLCERGDESEWIHRSFRPTASDGKVIFGNLRVNELKSNAETEWQSISKKDCVSYLAATLDFNKSVESDIDSDSDDEVDMYASDGSGVDLFGEKNADKVTDVDWSEWGDKEQDNNITATEDVSDKKTPDAINEERVIDEKTSDADVETPPKLKRGLKDVIDEREAKKIRSHDRISRNAEIAELGYKIMTKTASAEDLESEATLHGQEFMDQLSELVERTIPAVESVKYFVKLLVEYFQAVFRNTAGLLNYSPEDLDESKMAVTEVREIQRKSSNRKSVMWADFNTLPPQVSRSVSTLIAAILAHNLDIYNKIVVQILSESSADAKCLYNKPNRRTGADEYNAKVKPYYPCIDGGEFLSATDGSEKQFGLVLPFRATLTADIFEFLYKDKNSERAQKADSSLYVPIPLVKHNTVRTADEVMSDLFKVDTHVSRLDDNCFTGYATTGMANLYNREYLAANTRKTITGYYISNVIDELTAGLSTDKILSVFGQRYPELSAALNFILACSVTYDEVFRFHKSGHLITMAEIQHSLATVATCAGVMPKWNRQKETKPQCLISTHSMNMDGLFPKKSQVNLTDAGRGGEFIQTVSVTLASYSNKQDAFYNKLRVSVRRLTPDNILTMVTQMASNYQGVSYQLKHYARLYPYQNMDDEKISNRLRTKTMSEILEEYGVNVQFKNQMVNLYRSQKYSREALSTVAILKDLLFYQLRTREDVDTLEKLAHCIDRDEASREAFGEDNTAED